MLSHIRRICLSQGGLPGASQDWNSPRKVWVGKFEAFSMSCPNDEPSPNIYCLEASRNHPEIGAYPMTHHNLALVYFWLITGSTPSSNDGHGMKSASKINQPEQRQNTWGSLSSAPRISSSLRASLDRMTFQTGGDNEETRYTLW